MKVIETASEYERFTLDTLAKKVIAIPILSDSDLHYMNNKMILLYVKIVGGQSYTLSFDHSESSPLVNFPKDFKPEEIWTDDQIILEAYLNADNIKDAAMYLALHGSLLA